MDIKDENLISTIFNDKNLNKDERYMILTLKYCDIEEVNIIKVTLRELMDIFNATRASKITSILKSLESKGYIEILKSRGKVSSYSFIKEGLTLKKCDKSTIDKIAPSDEKVGTLCNNKTAPSDEKVGTLCNNKTAPSDEKVGTLCNNKTTPGDKKVTTLCTEQITPRCRNTISSSDKTAPSKVIKSSSSHEGEIADKPSGIAYLEPLDETENTMAGNCKDNNINSYIYNNINNNKLYINIFNTWNKININKEMHINPKSTDAINTAAKVYSEGQIIQAIENYSKVYHSKHYYNHPWSLVSFLSRPNGIRRFMDKGDIWLSYKDKYKDEDLYGMDFDIEKYID